MKEIIYLDSEMVNSYLAQLDSGLMERFMKSLAMAKTEQEEASEGGTTTGSLGLSGTGVSQANTTSTKNSIVYSSTNTELNQIIFHDYALDILIDKLGSSNAISNKYNDGEFVLIKGEFRIYDFERLKASTSPDIMSLFDDSKEHNKKIDSQISQAKKSSLPKNEKNKILANLQSQKKPTKNSIMEHMNPIHSFAKFSNAIFPGYCLIRINNLVCLCPKSSMRVTDATLTLLNESNRSITVLGVTIAKFDSERIPKYMDGSNQTSLSTIEIASSVPNMLAGLMLLSMELCEADDYFIRPIAIYFE